MKKTLLSLFTCFASFAGSAQTPVLFSTYNFTGQVLNNPITVTPLDSLISDSQNLYAGPPVTLQPTNGVAATYLMPGDYRVVIQGIGQAWTITVPATTTPQNAAAIPKLGVLSQNVFFWTNALAGVNLLAANGSALTNLPGPLNINDLGAKPNSPLDSTPAFTAATAALANGGTIYFPTGVYFVNGVIGSANGIVLKGMGAAQTVGTVVRTTSLGTVLMPTDPTRPVIQCGNDSGGVNSITFEDLSFGFLTNNFPNNGLAGLIIGGGAYHVRVHRCSFAGFNTNLWIAGGATYSVSYTYIEDCTIQCGPNNVYGIGVGPSAQYTTATFIHHCDILDSFNSGFCLYAGQANDTLYMMGGHLEADVSDGLPHLIRIGPASYFHWDAGYAEGSQPMVLLDWGDGGYPLNYYWRGDSCPATAVVYGAAANTVYGSLPNGGVGGLLQSPYIQGGLSLVPGGQFRSGTNAIVNAITASGTELSINGGGGVDIEAAGGNIALGAVNDNTLIFGTSGGSAFEYHYLESEFKAPLIAQGGFEVQATAANFQGDVVAGYGYLTGQFRGRQDGLTNAAGQTLSAQIAATTNSALLLQAALGTLPLTNAVTNVTGFAAAMTNAVATTATNAAAAATNSGPLLQAALGGVITNLTRPRNQYLVNAATIGNYSTASYWLPNGLQCQSYTGFTVPQSTTISNLYVREFVVVGSGTNFSVYLYANGIVNSNLGVSGITLGAYTGNNTSAGVTIPAGSGNNSWIVYCNYNGTQVPQFGISWTEQ